MLSRWTTEDWRAALADLPLDAGTFQDRFEVHPDRLIADLRTWWHGPDRAAGALSGNLGLLMLTLICLRYSENNRTGVGTDGHDCAADCQRLVADPAVQRAIHAIYTPGKFPTDLPNLGSPAQQTNAEREWRAIDPASLRFHRHGTTSFILVGSTVLTHGHRGEFALKCLVHPYLRIPAIARATVDYQRTYGAETGELEHLIRVWASSDSWILMDLVHGDQLDAYVRKRLAAERPNLGLRLGPLEELGTELLSALEELERRGQQHGDLSMSNILVVDRGDRIVLRLIDLGPNYLHTQRIPGRAGGAQYVAPEVRSDRADLHRADLYSLGQLLINFAGTASPVDGTVPDDFYSEAPLLARFLEDLIDNDPARRLIVFEPEPAKPVYPQLKTFFTGEIAAIRATRKASLTHPHSPWYMHLRELFRPLSGAPAEQRRLWEFRREHDSQGNRTRLPAHLGWLHWWAMAGAYAFFVAAAGITMWWLRDVGLGWDNRAIELLQRVTGSSEDRLPFVDDLRAGDYPLPDPQGSLPARLVCLSFAFAGAKYYQNLFAGLTPLVAVGVDRALQARAVIAEVAMRAMTLVPAVLTLIPTLIDRDWWPICTAIGITATFLCNLACAGFARTALTRAAAAGLTTVPREAGNPARPDVPGARALNSWAGTAAFYGVACWTIGLLIYHEILRDVLVYAIAVTSINVILFYVVRCGVNARYLRAGLVRACLAAERLSKLEKRRGSPVPRQDRRAPREPRRQLAAR
ncbi:serine/threonine-protein kinase [Micromonospora sp. NPDC049559]|uniref:serine/threonine-protein kinase n=1 Tax=Micromonospora sp. NPDC049559 TaxID=3155923 RepID=UPI003422291F